MRRGHKYPPQLQMCAAGMIIHPEFIWHPPAVTAILNELDNLLTKQAIEKRFLSIKFATDVSDAEKLKTSISFR